MFILQCSKFSVKISFILFDYLITVANQKYSKRKKKHNEVYGEAMMPLVKFLYIFNCLEGETKSFF